MSENKVEFKPYRRKATPTEMRPYIPGESLEGISVSAADTPKEGGMIARNPKNFEDQWYINESYFRDNFEEAPTTWEGVRP